MAIIELIKILDIGGNEDVDAGVVELKVPDIGGHEVDVISVEIKVGDKVAIDDTLITVEDDKATMDIPADSAGVISKVCVQVGDKISEGSIIAIIGNSSENTHLKKQEKPIMTKQTNTKFKDFPFLEKKAIQATIALKIEAHTQMVKYPFLIINNGNQQAVFDTETRLLWYADSKKNWNRIPEDFHFLGLHSWQLPNWQTLLNFAQKRNNNPWAIGSNNRLFYAYDWSVQNGWFDLDSKSSNGFTKETFSLKRAIAVNHQFCHADGFYDLLCWITENQCQILLSNRKELDLDWFSLPDDLEKLLTDIDYQRCRLPHLDSNRFRDVHQGMWELVGLPEKMLLEQGVRARNPALDIKSGSIGIDFGTSSTVVAYEDENGRARLLRIGVDDFYQEAQPIHYENPTILEFIDFEKFQTAWTDMAYQPIVNWDDVRCSHEALQKLRCNDGNVAVVSSMLPKIKQWALREANDIRVRISDQECGKEHELAPLSLRNPVKGKKLTVSSSDPFDPIELYAWFLGLNINWRNRGIFLTYYLTFPVAYPKEVKEKILASFRRGLLRSLPESLADNSEIMEKFNVEERASEPAAYVAAAMPAHNIEPTEEGVAYAVFDFGGGTTDFDFGFYRWANEQEENEGIETVFEHFEAAGDKFLGGENLLENLAYRVFCHNLDVCRSNEISFTRPLDADDFSGSEMLVAKTQSAYTNILMLMAKLRTFWEQGERENTGILKLNLINRDGESQPIELSVPYDQLQEYLEKRILLGIEDFFVSMKKAFANKMPRTVHILLAGNSSRSRLVTDSFNLLPEENIVEAAQARRDITQKIITDVFGGVHPELISYAPLAADKENESIPTAKTGVALGILKLQKGSGVKVINHAGQSTDEAPFAHYIGNQRRGKFNVGLVRNEAYGVWKKIGVPSENVFHLYHTQSNLAFNGNMDIGYNELFKKNIQFAGKNAGKSVFVRAVQPNVIEICLAVDETAVQNDCSDNLQEVTLS